MEKPEIPVRQATADAAASIARLLHDFNAEYSEPTPGVEELTEHARRLLEEGEIAVLLAGAGPDGLALLRFRPSVWTGEVGSAPAGALRRSRSARPWDRPGAAGGDDRVRPRCRCHQPRPQHRRDRHRRPRPLREHGLHQPRGRPRRAADALLRARALSRQLGEAGPCGRLHPLGMEEMGEQLDSVDEAGAGAGEGRGGVDGVDAPRA